MWNDNEFNSTFSSPGGNRDNVKKPTSKHIVPVTAQIIQACSQVENESSLYEYNHLKFNQVCFVGIIKNVIKRANDITYLIDDMTSNLVNVKLQSDDENDIESEESNEPQSAFIENQCVKVYGIIKSLQGQKILQAFRILPLGSLNELTYHMLECMNASIYYMNKEKGVSESGEPVMNERGASSSNPLKGANLRGANGTGLVGIQSQIATLVRQSRSSEGVHVREMRATFPELTEDKLREVLDFLSTEGHIYSTIDDEHYKTTDSM